MTRTSWTWDNYPGNLEWLQTNTIYLTRHGSHAYGTNIETSDEDWRGVAIPPVESLLGTLHKFEQAETKVPDITIFSLSKFINLATQCNPNVIEILFVDENDIEICKTNGRHLLNFRNNFLTKRVRHTFSGYAKSQLNRIDRHYRWLKSPPTKKPERSDFGLPNETLVPNDQLKAIEAEIQKRLEHWSMNYLDGIDDANRIALVNRFAEHLADIQVASQADLWEPASRTLGASDNLIEAMKKERAYTSAKREFDNYQKWKTERNPARAELEAKFGYDSKHASHLVRLLRMCREILEGKGVIVKRPDAQELLSIRNGAWSYEKLSDFANQEDKDLQEVAEKSTLPKSPDIEKIDKWLVDTLRSWI